MIKIKRVVLILTSILLITGCNLKSSDNVKSFTNYNNTKISYKLSGIMSIVSNEDEFKYNVEVGVDNQKYYKVDLKNQINDHEQVILKNDDGVYVVTPSLNKSYKFASNWPSNSSQIYLIERLVYDVKNNESKVKKNDNGYEIQTNVNYPNNKNLVKEKIIVDKNFNIKEVYVYDSDENIQISLVVSNIDYSPNFDSEYFKLESLITDTESEEDNSQTTSNILEDIIYPLYVPSDTYLESKDTVNNDETSRHILTFSGSEPFILVEEVSNVNSEMEIIPVNGEPALLGGTIGALSDNSLSWTINGVDYYLTSSNLDISEMMTIAESITNSSQVINQTK